MFVVRADRVGEGERCPRQSKFPRVDPDGGPYEYAVKLPRTKMTYYRRSETRIVQLADDAFWHSISDWPSACLVHSVAQYENYGEMKMTVLFCGCEALVPPTTKHTNCFLEDLCKLRSH